MANSIEQVEKNTSASFGYVKKDMLMLNDAFSDLHDKMQHLSMNHAMLLEEIGKLKKELAIATGKESKTSKKKATTSKKVTTKKVAKKAPAKKKTAKKKAVKKVVKETTVYK